MSAARIREAATRLVALAEGVPLEGINVSNFMARHAAYCTALADLRAALSAEEVER